jgi:hypothetical protein
MKSRMNLLARTKVPGRCQVRNGIRRRTLHWHLMGNRWARHSYHASQVRGLIRLILDRSHHSPSACRIRPRSRAKRKAVLVALSCEGFIATVELLNRVFDFVFIIFCSCSLFFTEKYYDCIQPLYSDSPFLFFSFFVIRFESYQIWVFAVRGLGAFRCWCG